MVSSGEFSRTVLTLFSSCFLCVLEILFGHWTFWTEFLLFKKMKSLSVPFSIFVFLFHFVGDFLSFFFSFI